MFKSHVRKVSSGPVIPLYARPANLRFIRGEGCYIFDSKNRKFLDFTSGIAVNALGHNHPKVVEIIRDQASKLIHLSNLYDNEYQTGLAHMIVDSLKLDKKLSDAQVFFCNSGTEANEAAFKFARKYAKEKFPSRPNKTGIVSFTNAFHGRTMGSLSATPNPKYQKPFLPLVPGFQTLPFNDISTLEKIDSDVCAVIVEPVQGEGGIRNCSPEFIEKLWLKCKEVDALLIFDEIQCGIGRTGTLFGFHQFCAPECTAETCCRESGCFSPDMITMAKPLAAGLPLGAVVASRNVSNILKAGDHGTTYGGGPMMTRVGQFVWKTISDPAFLSHVIEMGKLIRLKGEKLVKTSPVVKEIRGSGLLMGIELREGVPTSTFVDLCREHGVLVVSASGNTIRLIPALIVTPEEIDAAFVVFEKVISQMEALLASGKLK